MDSTTSTAGVAPTTVTVVIPTFNRSEWLGELIEASLAQTRVPDVVLVADNGSSDGTQDLMRRYEDEARVRYLRRPDNIDPMVNQNEALSQVETDYVVLLPDDDRIYSDFIRATADVLDRDPGVGMAHTAFDLVDQDGATVLTDVSLVERIVATESGAEFIRSHMRDRWRVAVGFARTEALRDVGFLATEGVDWLMADMVMWMNLAVSWNVAYLPTTLAGIRIHPGTLTATRLGFREQGYALSRETPDQYLGVRRRFVHRHREALVDPNDLCRRAERSWRLDTLDYISQTTYPERRRRAVLPQLWNTFRTDRGVVGESEAWRLLAVSLAGRRVTTQLRRLRRRLPRSARAA